MLRILLPVLFCCLVVLPGYRQSVSEMENEFTEKVELRVDGVACPFCSYGLEKKLLSIEGVESHEINIDKGIVILTIKTGKSIKEKDVKQKVIDAGFTLVEVKQLEKSN